MNSEIRKLSANSTPREPSSTIQSPGRRTSGDTSEGNFTSVKSRSKIDGRSVDQQTAQKMHKFRASILALDPNAKFFVDRDPLKVIHSKCGGQSTQKATGDISNFREHVGICKGPHTSSDYSNSPMSSLQSGPGRSIHPTAVMLARPAQLTCPGFSFEEMFGMGYDDLESQEREQVISAARVAGLLLLHSEGKSSVISMSCLKKSPSHQDPVQPCHHCSKVLGLSGFRNTLRSKKSKLDRYSPFLSIDAQMIRAGEDQKAANGKA